MNTLCQVLIFLLSGTWILRRHRVYVISKVCSFSKFFRSTERGGWLKNPQKGSKRCTKMSETHPIITQTTLLTSPSSLVRRSLSRRILSKVCLVFKLWIPINITDGANGSICQVNSASSFAATFSRLSKQLL